MAFPWVYPSSRGPPCKADTHVRLLQDPAAQLLLSLTPHSGSGAPYSTPTPRYPQPQQQLLAEEPGEAPISAGDAAPAWCWRRPQLPQRRPLFQPPSSRCRLPLCLADSSDCLRALGDSPSGLPPTAVMDPATWLRARAPADVRAPGAETPPLGVGKQDGASLLVRAPAPRDSLRPRLGGSRTVPVSGRRQRRSR